jgi:hypothetical protein
VCLHAHAELAPLPARGLNGRRADEDDDRDPEEDERGDDRPDDLQAGVAVDLRPLRVAGGPPSPAEADDEEDKGGFDGDEDEGADPEHEPVELVDGIAARGLGGGR